MSRFELCHVFYWLHVTFFYWSAQFIPAYKLVLEPVVCSCYKTIWLLRTCLLSLVRSKQSMGTSKLLDNIGKQAGLSRATLPMSFPLIFPLELLYFMFCALLNQIQQLLINSTFNILRSSTTGGFLNFKQFLILVWSPKSKFKI